MGSAEGTVDGRPHGLWRKYRRGPLADGPSRSFAGNLLDTAERRAGTGTKGHRTGRIGCQIMSLNILIVDDSPVMRSFVRRVMQLSALDVNRYLEAANRADTLDGAASQPLDAVSPVIT